MYKNTQYICALCSLNQREFPGCSDNYMKIGKNTERIGKNKTKERKVDIILFIISLSSDSKTKIL